MVPVLDIKGRKETAMEASTSKNAISQSKNEGIFDTGTSLNEQDMEIDIINYKNDDEDLDVDIINCTNDDEDVEVDIINCTNDDEDVEVDIINCTNDDVDDLVQPQCDDATASSSSFDDTFSNNGNHEYENDDEVMSELRGDVFPVRKKRVTSHWRKFVQPIMWRCKWLDLQLRKFQFLTNKYDKELEKYNQRKHFNYGNIELEGGCAKSMPLFHVFQREKPIKRKIRKRREETDTKIFMSQHHLFSYLSTCRSHPHGPTMDDDQSNLGLSTDKNVGNEFKVPDELLSLDFRDDYSLEQLLWRIEASESRIVEMKTKINTIMTENAGRIEDVILHESNNNNNAPVRESSDFPTNMDGPSVVANFASQLMKLNVGDDLVKPHDLVKPENSGSGHGEGNRVGDANEPVEQPSVASRKRSTDGILIYNRRAKKPKTDSADIKHHPINNTAPVSVSEDSSQNEQRPPKLCSISKLTPPKNKKKRAARARRKSGSSLWSRRTSS